MANLTLLQQRNSDLNNAYCQIIKATKDLRYVSRATIISLLQEMSAPRFYLTPFAAWLYIKNYRNRSVNSRKKEMVQDLIANFNKLRVENPNAPKEWLYERVVELPAKSFYMSPHRMEEIIFNYTGRVKK